MAEDYPNVVEIVQIRGMDRTDTRIQRFPKADEAEKRELVAKACDAINYAFDRGIKITVDWKV